MFYFARYIGKSTVLIQNLIYGNRGRKTKLLRDMIENNLCTIYGFSIRVARIQKSRESLKLLETIEANRKEEMSVCDLLWSQCNSTSATLCGHLNNS